MKLLVVLSSVRKGRAGAKITDWFVEQVKADSTFDVDLVDLKELNLSYELPEAVPSSIKNGAYEDEADRQWAERVKSADAIAFVSPEYNHGIPASLKNALDHLYYEWEGKPAAFIGYGASGAGFSNAAFNLTAHWLKMDLISARVGISEIWAAFNENGELNFADKYNHEAKAVIGSLAAKVAK